MPDIKVHDRVILAGETDLDNYGTVLSVEGSMVMIDFKWGGVQLWTRNLLHVLEKAERLHPRRTVSLPQLREIADRCDTAWRVSLINIENTMRNGALLEAEDVDIGGERCTRLLVDDNIVAVYTCPVYP